MWKIGKIELEAGLMDYEISEQLTTGIEIAPTVDLWVSISKYLWKDYKFIRKRLQEMDYNLLTNEEKLIVCQYRATGESNCKQVLGNSFNYWMTDFDLRSQECRKDRFALAKTIMIKNVSLMDRYTILGVLNSTNLENNYLKYGIEGTSEGDPIEGLFNFIEATGSYINGIKNMNLTMVDTRTKAQMIDDMMYVLRNGK